MKKIRIGNDFVFAWEIERNGLPEDLSSVLEKHLHLSVFGKRVELVEGVDYDITGNVIRIEVTPTIANILGTYKAEFRYILPDNGFIDEDRKCAVDVDAFQIVAKTAQSDDSTEFSMTSDMAIAFKGDKGDSAYQVWLEEGNTGTEEDYFAYLRQPAIDAGASISELEGEIQVSEGLRIQAEGERDLAETARIQSESERLSAEILRQSNEGDRIENEDTRVQNEAERISKEGIRQSNEIDRVESEGVRVQAENERAQAEVERQVTIQEAVTATNLANEKANLANDTAQSANEAADSALTATQEATTAASLADTARLAIQDDLALKADHGYESNPKTLKEVDDSLVQLAGDVSAISENFERSKQLFDKENDTLRVGGLLTSGGMYITNHNIVVTIPRNRIPSDTFTIQTNSVSYNNQSRVVFLQGSTILSTVIGDGVSKTTTHVIPENCDTIKIHAGYLINVVSLPLRDNPLVNTFVLNDGAIAFPHEEYNKYTLKEESIPDDLVALVNKDILITAPGKNLLNEALIDFTKRYSPSSLSIVNSQNTIYVGTPYIKVKGGEFYAINIVGYSGGGYFKNIGDTNAVSKIIVENPVDNIGYLFQVPMEYDGYYVVINLLRTDPTDNTLRMDYQIEHGEQVTEYEPYEEVEQFNPEYLINNDVPPTPIPTDTLLDKLTDVNSITKIKHEKLPLFFKYCRLKDKDINVVNSGTSLFARTNEHCTLHPKANERPPLFHSMNAATHIWDAIKWDSQFYRRYDYPGFFTETGSFATTSNLPEWDDNIYRAGFTRYSDSASSSISFQIPINAWQFNLIYRTDGQASENIVLNVTQGDNHVEVFNGTDWVEANGFSFSQLQVESFLTNVTIPDARTGTSQVIASYKIGGNTTYQKRLKMRCKSNIIDTRNIVKDLSIINNGTGRFMYWGVEWSVREHMITLINAARGSHNISIVGPNSTNSLSHYQDNEVWGFEPDLILTENPIHNSGASSPPTATFPTNYWGDVTNDFFFGDNPVSMKSRATVHGLDPEYLIFTSSIAWNFGGINDDGTLKVGTDKDGNSYTALESFSMAHQYLVDNHPNVLAINSVNYWVKSGFDVYGDLRTATEGSGKDGLTFTNEGSHWNDTGSKIIAKTILPMLKFY